MDINTRSNDNISVCPIIQEVTVKPYLEVRVCQAGTWGGWEDNPVWGKCKRDRMFLAVRNWKQQFNGLIHEAIISHKKSRSSWFQNWLIWWVNIINNPGSFYHSSLHLGCLFALSLKLVPIMVTRGCHSSRHHKQAWLSSWRRYLFLCAFFFPKKALFSSHLTVQTVTYPPLEC